MHYLGMVALKTATSRSGALLIDGTMWCWGDSGNGQLGVGLTDSQHAGHIVFVTADGHIRMVAADGTLVWKTTAPIPGATYPLVLSATEQGWRAWCSDIVLTEERGAGAAGSGQNGTV